MTLKVLPDAERLIMNYLRANADVAAVLGQRVYTRLPDNPEEWPLAVVIRIGGGADPNGWHDRARLQVEVWADRGGRPQASDAAGVVRAALDWRQVVGTYDEGVVTDVRELNTLYLPDPTTSRPRYVWDGRVETHPTTT